MRGSLSDLRCEKSILAQGLLAFLDIFEGLSESSLSRFLQSCDLRPREKRLLLDKRLWTISSKGCTIAPSAELIWELSHENRGRIYSILAKSSSNYPQHFPFRFALNGF